MKQLYTTILAFLVMTVLFGGTLRADDPQARLQIIHNAADPAAEMVDIYVNGDPVLSDFAFRSATGFIPVPAGVALNVGVAAAGSDSAADTLKNFVVTFEAGETYIAIANGVLDPAEFTANPDELDIEFTLFAKAGARQASTEPTEVQFIAVHGSTDAPTVDILARGVGPLVQGAAYGAITDYIGVPAGEYILDITPAGENETIVASFVADLSGLAGGAAAVLASGFFTPETNQNGEAFGLIAVLPDGTVIELPAYEPMARLQVIHNAADPAAASVDVYVNGDLLLPGFGFREATPFIDVPAEVELTIEVTPAGDATVVGTFDVTLADGGTYVVIANGVLNPDNFAANPENVDIDFTLFIKDNAREESTDPAEVQFFIVHGSTDAPAVDISARGVAMLAQNVPYGGISDYLGVPANQYIIDILPAGGSEPVASFTLDISGLAGGTAVVLASGFLDPSINQNGEAFNLIAVLADGTVLSITTGVEKLVRDIPMEYNISQNYPNPFNPVTTIRFSLPEVSAVSLEIYNMLGQKIVSLVDNEQLSAGVYNIEWNGRDSAGRQVSSGMYIYRINAGDFTATKSMMLLK